MIHLSQAVLCQDCERISASTGNCEGCDSSALLNLARVLNREESQLDSLHQLVETTLKGYRI